MLTYSSITATIDSPIGPLALTARDGTLTGVFMADEPVAPVDRAERDHVDDWFAPVTEQFRAYFAGTSTTFDVPLALDGTPFQRAVWEQLLTIPYGETWSYGELARAVGNPNAARAVGLANSRNPLAIIVPCHRVVATSGHLTGYAGGLDRKRWLLAHERAHAGTQLFTQSASR